MKKSFGHMKFATLRSRLILGFALVTVPLVILLLWNNMYATRVVHSQVALSNKNLLTIYMNDMDKVLEEIENYLYKSAEQDQSLISLSQYDRESWEYYLSKTETVNNLYTNTNYYSAADCLFAYSSKYDELFLAPQYSVSYERKESIQEKLHVLLSSEDGATFYNKWTLVEEDGKYALLRVVDTNYSSYIGAWVDLDHLMQPLDVLSKEGKGESLLLSEQGKVIANLNPVAGQSFSPEQWKSFVDQGVSSYNIVHLEKPYLLVAKQSRMAPMTLVLLLPEKSLLEGLPFFRNLTYTVPLVALAILIIYLIFLQQSIVRPIYNLIHGMRKIRSGNLSARLEDNKLVEFVTINEAFNAMATQIEHLKINIYEEQIRTQKAELKHLQAQIHPHFFMNSLNIVYNLAQIRSYELIQSMSLHLVRYFRYTTRTHLSTISLQEEAEHVHNYLTIQRFRFPETLDFEIDIPPQLKGCAVPPLIIQPLVENAVIHGFSLQNDSVFRIKVTAYETRVQEDSFLCIEVRDNGKGLSEEQIRTLKRRVNSIEPEDGHIGLWNIMRRCKLYYKSDIRMEFAAVQPGGTTITLIVPLWIHSYHDSIGEAGAS
ncbi:sensor histidine kinase [Paenibacillus sp. NFR01]|uniref:sensor histidine kinase n=1 Tax=Paenibacillus sp. NFR01 TaxID=1566279 RepID=UPI0008B92FE4|nr:sensor histidine kinase [Paenibacillus sp. NFR01]SEU23684.1 two-component system, sensor histidine kinase YesM [Paenibacillus sp. NFR01]